MKLYTLILFSLFISTSAVLADEIKGGRVMCSITSPTTMGFDLIKVKKTDRDWSGTYELNDLRFSGTYRSTSSAFTLDVITLNEDGEPTEKLLQVDTKLRTTEHMHVKFKRDQSNIELYCYYLPNQ